MQRIGGEQIGVDSRSRLESAYSADLSTVRIHADSSAASESNSLDAEAFTVGEHISFAARAYTAGAPPAEQLLAHEVAHVLQSRLGGVDSKSGNHTHDAAEAEADNLSARAATGGGAKPMTPARGVLRKPRGPVTAAEISEMSRRPRSAFARWDRLTEGERNGVLSQMTERYGLAFASDFQQAAKHTALRRNHTAVITEGAQVGFTTTDNTWLIGHGFRLVGGAAPVLWTRPDGEEIRVLKRAKPAPETPPAGKSPDSGEASPTERQQAVVTGLNRKLVDTRFAINAWFDELRDARDKRDAKEYASNRAEMLKILGDVDQEIADLRAQKDALLRSDPTGRDPDLDVRMMDQLDELDDWRATVDESLKEFPETMPAVPQ